MTNLESSLWYFAHPYSVYRADGKRCPDGEKMMFELCNLRGARLLLAGFKIVSPISHSVPLCEEMKQAGADGDDFGWYELDNLIIAKTDFDGIVLAPGWEQSRGCVAERDLFEEQGKRILFYDTIFQEKDTPNANIVTAD